jgi:hypothetical protein
VTTAGRPDQPADPDAERVLSQALRAMAGGRDGPADHSAAGAGSPWSAAQVVLLALIVGLLVGMGVGIISLLV